MSNTNAIHSFKHYWAVAHACVPTCRNHIERDDLEAFLPPEQAEEAFRMLDQDGNGRLTLSEVRAAITNIFRRGPSLAQFIYSRRSFFIVDVHDLFMVDARPSPTSSGAAPRSLLIGTACDGYVGVHA